MGKSRNLCSLNTQAPRSTFHWGGIWCYMLCSNQEMAPSPNRALSYSFCLYVSEWQQLSSINTYRMSTNETQYSIRWTRQCLKSLLHFISLKCTVSNEFQSFTLRTEDTVAFSTDLLWSHTLLNIWRRRLLFLRYLFLFLICIFLLI